MEPMVRKVVFRDGLRVIALWLRANVPDSGVKHKGKLNKSIRYNVKAGGLLGVVRSVAPHAHLVHEGTRAHPVPLDQAKALILPGIGYRHSAMHPGSRANPFLTNAATETEDEVMGVMRHSLQAAIDAIAAGATE